MVFLRFSESPGILQTGRASHTRGGSMERFRPTRARAGHREAARLANTKQRKTRIAVSSTSMELAHGPRAHVRADRARRRARPCQRNNRTHAFAFSEPSAALASSEQLWQWLGIRLSATVAVFAVYYIFFVPIQQVCFLFSYSFWPWAVCARGSADGD